MNREFPTIKQIEDAILFAMSDNNGKCEYHQDTHTFIATELVPIVCRDDGGSIDSIDYIETPHTISFQDGYHYWVAMMDFINNIPNPIPAPVAPWYGVVEDDGLPF